MAGQAQNHRKALEKAMREKALLKMVKEKREITCPNCGAMIPVKALKNSCPSCGKTVTIDFDLPRRTPMDSLQNKD